MVGCIELGPNTFDECPRFLYSGRRPYRRNEMAATNLLFYSMVGGRYRVRLDHFKAGIHCVTTVSGCPNAWVLSSKTSDHSFTARLKRFQRIMAMTGEVMRKTPHTWAIPPLK